MRFFEFDVAEEEFCKRRVVGVVGDEGRSDDGEFFVKLGETEFGFVTELRGIEEDDEGVGSWGFDGGDVTGDGLVVKVDYSGSGS